GTLTFQNGTTVLSTTPLVNGQVSCTKAFTSSGTRSITAVYSGDSNNLAGTSAALNQVVKTLPATTTSMLISSLNPSLFGQSVTFTATVTSPYSPIPDGHTVNFFNGSALLASVLTINGLARYTTSSLTAVSHTIKASFVGD